LEISTEQIKTLREKTGAGVMDCKKALTEANGNLEEAIGIIIKRGLSIANKKVDRATSQGLIETYVHAGGKLGVMVEVNCETDFVARTDEFKTLAHDIALQIAAMSPVYISVDEVHTEADVEKEKVCLLLQPCIKDPTKTIQDMVTQTIAKTGENIKINRFVRFELGF